MAIRPSWVITRPVLLVRRFSGLFAAGIAGAALFIACSSDQKSRFPGDATSSGPGSGTGGGNSTTGNISGGSGGNGIGTGTGSGGGGGSGPPPLVPCDISKPCPMNQICVKGPMGGVCSTNGGPCDPAHDMCQNDTYCCGPGCRIDNGDPVCVSGGTRPVNGMCNTAIAVGVFAPDLQCEWKAPAAGDPFPKHKQVLTTALVADLPNNSGTAAEIVIVTSDSTSGARAADGTGGRIRILNGQTCAQVEVISAGPAVRDAATPAIGDLDGDGKPEIVARANFPANNTLIAFTWKTDHYDVMWQSQADGSTPGIDSWDGVSIHDLDNDGFPEVIGRGGAVFNGRTGAVLTHAGGGVILESDPVLGDVDHDGAVELVANQVFGWDAASKTWKVKYPGMGVSDPKQAATFYAFADFGTRGAQGNFDHSKKDGRAEVVAVGAIGGDPNSGMVGVYTLEGETVMRVNMPTHSTPCRTGQEVGERGGAPTIGDFDGDRMPEIAYAGAYAYRVYDLDCRDAGQGCQDPTNYIRWSQPSQDCSSGATGSTIFDFEGDGKAEAIYADECFVRVYDGKSGEVLFSTYRSSATWWDQPIVADPDHSDRSKIIFSGSSNAMIFGNCYDSGEMRTPPDTTDPGKNGFVDKIYKGLRCLVNDDCPSQNCVQGYCRCMTDKDCGNNWVRDPMDLRATDAENGFVCTSAIAGTPGAGNVCRMQHGNITTIDRADQYFTGIKVFRDKRDRWASSRSIWNQHAYSITNVNDNGTIPKTSDWAQTFIDPKMNNYRQNRQGATSADLADITGALDGANVCQLTKAGGVLFTGQVCNRGLRGVAANMPATFYLGGGDAGPLGMELCRTTTQEPVPVGGCRPVTCEIPRGSVPDNSTITMIVNDAGGGAPGMNRITDECKYDNNTAVTMVGMCAPPPK